MHVSIQQVFIEYLMYTRSWVGPWGHNDDKSLWCQGTHPVNHTFMKWCIKDNNAGLWKPLGGTAKPAKGSWGRADQGPCRCYNTQTGPWRVSRSEPDRREGSILESRDSMSKWVAVSYVAFADLQLYWEAGKKTCKAGREENNGRDMWRSESRESWTHVAEFGLYPLVMRSHWGFWARAAEWDLGCMAWNTAGGRGREEGAVMVGVRGSGRGSGGGWFKEHGGGQPGIPAWGACIVPFFWAFVSSSEEWGNGIPVHKSVQGLS